jgi:DNA-directed RNA polymerase specialized sigma24 family protein
MDQSSNAPSFHNLDPNAEAFLARLIKKKVRQMIDRADFRPGDEPDIEQQLRLKVTQHLSAYRGDQGHLLAFLTAIVERKVASILRDGNAEKRHPRRVVSLNIQVAVRDEGPVELGATVTQQEAGNRLGVKFLDHETAFNLKHDVDATIQKLTPDERKICEALKHGSITQVSLELGIPRTTIYDMIARWREQFQDEGLREYL